MCTMIKKPPIIVALATLLYGHAYASTADILKDPSHMSIVRALFNGILSSYAKTKTTPPEVRYFDPAQGRSDCEEQAVLWMDLIRSGKLFDDLDDQTRIYLILRYVFIDQNNRDPFGMVVSGEDQAWTQTHPDLMALRRQISEEVDLRIMAQARALFPVQDLKDTIFTQTPVGPEGLTRISTLAGIKILFAYAKRNDIPILLKIKRMVVRKEGGFRGQGETLLSFSYDQTRNRFVVKKEIAEAEKQCPAFCIRLFSIVNQHDPHPSAASDFLKNEEKLNSLLAGINSKDHKIPLLKTKEGLKKILMLWDNLTKAGPFESYISHVKEADMEDLLWMMAARDDEGHGRDLLSSQFLSPYMSLKEILRDDESYTNLKEGKMVYTGVGVTLAIRHVYVSTYAQQEESLKPLFQSIITNDPITFEEDKSFEKLNKWALKFSVLQQSHTK